MGAAVAVKGAAVAVKGAAVAVKGAAVAVKVWPSQSAGLGAEATPVG
jgi:hypothetical protein